MFARTAALPSLEMASPPDDMTMSVSVFNWAIAKDDAKNDVILALPHPGFNWIGFRYPKALMIKLVEQLNETMAKMPKMSEHCQS